MFSLRSSFIPTQLIRLGILHLYPILLIFNIPSLAVLENIFAHSCGVLACFSLLYTNRSLVFSLSLATDFLQLLFISFIDFTFQIVAEMRKKLFCSFCSQKCTELMDLKEEMFGTYFKQCRAFKSYYRILSSLFFPLWKEVEVMLTTILVPFQRQDMGRALWKWS